MQLHGPPEAFAAGGVCSTRLVTPDVGMAQSLEVRAVRFKKDSTRTKIFSCVRHSSGALQSMVSASEIAVIVLPCEAVLASFSPNHIVSSCVWCRCRSSGLMSSTDAAIASAGRSITFLQVKVEFPDDESDAEECWSFDHIKATIARSEAAPDVLFFCGPENLTRERATARVPAAPRLDAARYALTLWTRAERGVGASGCLDVELRGADGKLCTGEVRDQVICGASRSVMQSRMHERGNVAIAESSDASRSELFQNGMAHGSVYNMHGSYQVEHVLENIHHLTLLSYRAGR